MKKCLGIKTSLYITTVALLVCTPAGYAKAASITIDTGSAGISRSLDKYYNLYTKGRERSTSEQDPLTVMMTEIVSPYQNLGISIADNYVNIRMEPNTDSEIVGKLYRGCAADILEYVGDWVRIESGEVKGYIKSEFLAIGKDAEEILENYCTKYATVTTETLRVRDIPSTEEDSKIKILIPFGETYIVVNELDEWAEILVGEDDATGKEVTGFVSKDYIDIDVKFEYAISIEEEKARIAAEEAAKKAERERLEKLAAEEAAKKAEEKRRKEAAAIQQTGSNSSSGSSSSGSSSNSSKRSEIVDYALKFVGNRYVWGGTSLTKGADCSGFVQTLYKNFGYSIPRTSREQAVSAGVKVSVDNIQKGDLIFYTNSSGTVNHVAMYIGNGQIVHASNAREGIKISKYNYRSIYRVRRVIQ